MAFVIGWRPRQPTINPQCIYSLSQQHYFHLQNLVLYSTFINFVFGWRPRQPAINPQCIYSLSQQHWSLVGVPANQLCILIALCLLVNNLISINKFLCISPHLQINLKLILPIRIIYIFVISI